MQARQCVASTHKEAYIDVRDCVRAEQQRRIAKYFNSAKKQKTVLTTGKGGVNRGSTLLQKTQKRFSFFAR